MVGKIDVGPWGFWRNCSDGHASERVAWRTDAGKGPITKSVVRQHGVAKKSCDQRCPMTGLAAVRAGESAFWHYAADTPFSMHWSSADISFVPS